MFKKILLAIGMILIISLIFITLLWPYEPTEIIVIIDTTTQGLIMRNTPEQKREGANIYVTIITSAGQSEGKFTYDDARFIGRIGILNPGKMSSGYNIKITRPDGILEQFEQSRPKSNCLALHYTITSEDLYGEISPKRCR